MTTEYTNADAQQPLIPEQQEALDEVEEVVSNPFTRAVARRLIDENQISFTIPDTFTYIEHRPWGSGVFSPFKSLKVSEFLYPSVWRFHWALMWLQALCVQQ